MWIFSGGCHCCLRYDEVVKAYSKRNAFVFLARHHRSYKNEQQIVSNVLDFFIICYTEL